ncbi:hypothetical protein ScPMuIL_009549 [Solemya velum]
MSEHCHRTFYLTANCTAGQFINGSTCTACPKGSYQDQPLKSTCQHCPDGQTTINNGSDSPSDCIFNCTAGHFINGTTCTACPKGSYQDQPLKSTCQQCPDDHTTINSGSDSPSDCIYGTESDDEESDNENSDNESDGDSDNNSENEQSDDNDKTDSDGENSNDNKPDDKDSNDEDSDSDSNGNKSDEDSDDKSGNEQSDDNGDQSGKSDDEDSDTTSTAKRFVLQIVISPGLSMAATVIIDCAQTTTDPKYHRLPFIVNSQTCRRICLAGRGIYMGDEIHTPRYKKAALHGDKYPARDHATSNNPFRPVCMSGHTGPKLGECPLKALGWCKTGALLGHSSLRYLRVRYPHSAERIREIKGKLLSPLSLSLAQLFREFEPP